MTAINNYELAEIQDGFFNHFRFPGLSKIPGVFTSQRLLELQPGGSAQTDSVETLGLTNQLLTISFGYAQSYKNDLKYDNFSGSRTVRWISLYPAYERRFCPCSEDKTTNLFRECRARSALHLWRRVRILPQGFSARPLRSQHQLVRFGSGRGLFL